ncbi:DUF6300 family protein [Streptomyces sp. NPDC005953]|uniref:DUF6300 family protein n=1 Tax=Streptomyces sp. NPDC005953 TaxID=3156719 RepID=UPI003407A416
MPPCARCGGEPIVSLAGPVGGFGLPVPVQLCPACDADKPAARALLAFFTSGAGFDTSRGEEAARLMGAWQGEAMAACGFHGVPAPNTDSPPHTGPQLHGHG